ncbi:MAG: SDR family oxidoreductase [Gammaproteobacteria bacterium]
MQLNDKMAGDKVAGKVTVVTGGGSGFGAAFARGFGLAGARVVVADMNATTGEAVTSAIVADGGQASFVRADVSQSADVAALMQAAVDRYDGIDVVLNNAGMVTPKTVVADQSVEEFDRVMAVNVRSVFLGAKYAAPIMQRNGGGVIINTASTAALKPRPLNAIYATSKAAVLTLTKALAAELAPQRIRVNALSPVAADTPLLRNFIGNDHEAVERIAAAIPLERLCHPDDMVACALFLASDEASFLTGVNLPVDGGWTTI